MYASFKYEIANDCLTGKIGYFNRPFRAEMHDRTIYNMGLREILPKGKMVVCNPVYPSNIKVNWFFINT